MIGGAGLIMALHDEGITMNAGQLAVRQAGYVPLR